MIFESFVLFFCFVFLWLVFGLCLTWLFSFYSVNVVARKKEKNWGGRVCGGVHTNLRWDKNEDMRILPETLWRKKAGFPKFALKQTTKMI